MGLNNFLMNIAIKLNMATIKNNDDLSLKEQIRQSLTNERILSINMDRDVPVVRIVLKGYRDDLLFNKEDELIEKAKEIGSQIKHLSEKYKIYLIDEKYQIMIIIDQEHNVAYKE